MRRIAGFVSDLPPEHAKAQLSSMLQCMLHERFYTYRVHAVPELGCYLGLVSTGEPSSDDPFVIDHAQGKVIVFAG